MNTENTIVTGKRHRIWGWIFAMIGGLFTLLGITCFWGAVTGAGYEVNGVFWLFFPLLLIIGFPFLILGIQIIINKGKINNSHVWGWIFVILGVIFILLFFLSIFISIVIYKQPVEWAPLSIMFLMIGIIDNVLGTWLSSNREKRKIAIENHE